MVNEFPLLLSLVLFLVLLMAGMKVPFAIAIPGMIYVAMTDGFGFLRSLGVITWGSMNAYTLTAVPLFVLLAEIVLRSGLGLRMYRGLAQLLRFLPGGLLQVNIVGCGIFSAISGSSIATAASVTGVSIPELKRRGYNWRMSLGSLAAGGALGNLIPPSIIMIIYASFTDTSVSKLFIASIVPGVVLMLMFMAYIAIRALSGNVVPANSQQDDKLKLSPRELIGDLLPFSALILVTLGSIYAGIATPTEAAALACVASVTIGRIWGDLRLRDFNEAVINTVEIVGNILLIVLAAYLYSYAMSISGAGKVIATWIGSLGLGYMEFLIAMLVMYLVLGTFLDSMGMVILTVPVLYPILLTYGVDLIWFGVFLVVVVEIGLLTPPVGMVLFVIQGMTKANAHDVFMGALPFFFVMVVFIVILLFFPEMALWLPSHMK